MTLSELQAKREKLVTRISDAVKREQSGDRSLEYAPIEEMQLALQILDNEIAATSTASRTGRCVFIQYTNG